VGGSKKSAGFFLDSLALPTREKEPIVYKRAPVFVTDITVENSKTHEKMTLDGVFGMNFLVASAKLTEGLLPDLTVLLDLDPARARERLDADEKPFDRLESERGAFHDSVRTEFLALAEAEPDRFLVLDASRVPADLATDIQGRLQALLEADAGVVRAAD
jgi:hypothetical protein